MANSFRDKGIGVRFGVSSGMESGRKEDEEGASKDALIRVRC